MTTPRPGSRAHVLAVVGRLAAAYGPLPWTRRNAPVAELVTTILSHATTDANERRAFARLTARYPTWDAVRAAPVEDVMDAVRPAGMPTQKAPRIQRALAAVAADPRGGDLEWLGEVPLPEAMAWLTSLDGVGPKTAACVMCFSFGRPVLPVDTHVHRIALRLRLVPAGTAPAAAQELLSRRVPPDEVYATHMRMIRLGRAVCRARTPRCAACPLQDLCPAGRRAATGPGRRTPA
ncbi:MAG: endonuclease III [Actinomycetota bacterium]